MKTSGKVGQRFPAVTAPCSWGFLMTPEDVGGDRTTNAPELQNWKVKADFSACVFTLPNTRVSAVLSEAPRVPWDRENIAYINILIC